MNSEYANRYVRMNEERIKAAEERSRRDREEREKNHQAWLRLCGSAGMIGCIK